MLTKSVNPSWFVSSPNHFLRMKWVYILSFPSFEIAIAFYTPKRPSSFCLYIYLYIIPKAENDMMPMIIVINNFLKITTSHRTVLETFVISVQLLALALKFDQKKAKLSSYKALADFGMGLEHEFTCIYM